MDWMGSQQRDPWLRKTWTALGLWESAGKSTIKMGSISEGDWERMIVLWMGMVILKDSEPRIWEY